MKILRLINLFIIVLALTSSCVPSGGKNGKRIKKKVDGALAPEETIVESPNFSSDISWYDGQYINGIITINESYETLLYIRGNSIHNFLESDNNYTKKFCLAVSFNQSNTSAKNSFRARAIPITYNNYSSNSVERLFKIDIVDKTASASDCSGLINLYDAQNTQFGSSSSPSYSPVEVCPDCTGLITSLSMALYESNSGISENQIIPTSTLSLAGLGLRIDVKNNTTSGVSSCSDVSCSSQDFDCCLEGQCVKDGVLKPNPDQTDLPLALADVQSNSLAYKNWPSVYFVCGNNVQTDPDNTTDPVNASGNATEALNNLIKQYNCLEEGKQETPNYASNNVCLPDFDTTSYKAVRKDVWIKCGCEAFPFPLEPDEPYCPDFGLKLVKNEFDTITDVVCDIPTSVEQGPIQNLQLVVPARTAPHRFYDIGGVNYDDLETISVLPKPTQEGEEFSYLDPSGKTTPLKTTFSINAVLGKMNLDLSGARPAKMLPVEFDQTYIISALTGYYTPCSSCAVDSWYTAFSPHPTSQNGLGLRAAGYSTNRQNYLDNSTNGNYEDTIFGRACWLPPTMIPFSHNKDANLITQRQNRLTTQAALYINGYQRDWFGFNKGALIGSFDGVRWFAVGKSRRITATSKKLFLAINAPFADLADNTSITVSVITDLGVSSAASIDYDHLLPSDDPLQNEGGSCQRYHQCQVDSDCISTLGWEYTCADVDKFKTHLPKFDEDGVELVNDLINKANFDQFLHGTQPLAGEKRCVYKGAGSICKIHYDDNGLTDSQKKLFTCAPNFYCESLNGNQYNQELIRTSTAYNSIIFGQESDILGRPTNYNTGTNSGILSVNIKNNILSNASLYFNDNINDLGTLDFGICRPGKDISQNEWRLQHTARDSQGRTDFISQISSCDSTAIGDSRFSSCPTFDSDGNYTFDTGSYNQNRLQNMCGRSSLTSTSGNLQSTFKNIEEGIIGSFSSLFEKKVVADACFRRAGSVCHTDLDCSPGPLHGSESQYFDRIDFGNTEAELKFWQESLVCSQAEPKPLLQSEDYYDYDMTKNRCCREVGKELTMFTIGSADIIPANIDSEALDINQMVDPDAAAQGRYSRYTSIDGLRSVLPPTLDINTPYPQIPAVIKNETPQVYQWKTINDTGRRTCCGGGFIRKFSDGTNNWRNSNRVTVDPTNFKCLNYQSDLPFGNTKGADQDNYLNDFSKLCLSPASKGCIQIPIVHSESFEITPPVDYEEKTAILSTEPDSDPSSSSNQFLNLNRNVPYMPIIFKDPQNVLANELENPLSFFLDNIEIPNTAVSFFLPVYITDVLNIKNVDIVYMKTDDTPERVQLTEDANCALALVSGNPGGIEDRLDEEKFCIASNLPPNPITDPGRMAVFYARAKRDLNADGDFSNDWKYAWLEIEFYLNNNTEHRVDNIPTDEQIPMTPGNDMYYLTKLGKLELSGIPQITYEPLYCNTNKENLVPGIFDLGSDDQTRVSFESTAHSFVQNGTSNITGRDLMEVYESATTLSDDSNLSKNVTHGDKLTGQPVFSAHEFLCCQELGSSTAGDNLCCSGYSIDDPENQDQRICALPSGTDLNVYFNRFVSGEGSTGDNAFVDSDFVPETGELKLNTSVYQKLIEFGIEHCESNTVLRGAAFGYFNPGPHGTVYVDAPGSNEVSQRYHSIVDETADYDNVDDSGYAQFQAGYRWNHHKYCE